MGNTAEYDADRIGFLLRSHSEYGDVFAFDERTVFVIDPALAHDALTRTNRSFITELAPFEGRPDLDKIADQDGAWMAARRTVWPGLNHCAAAAADQRTMEIFDRIAGGTAGREIDVLTMMLTFTAHAVADYCFGPDATDIPGLLADSIDATEPFARASYQFPAWLPLRRHRRFFRAHRHTLDTLIGIVRRRRAWPTPAPPGDLLAFLLDADPAMPDGTVMSTLRGILMGGHGVPAAALASLVRELASHPRLVADLRDEAGGPSSLGDAPPTARLPLAEAVVKEVLRLYPPAWLMTRTARTATTLGNWSLRPGDEVLLNSYLIHRDPRWWQRPDQFDPGRWLDGPAPGNAYLPFGAGPRVCLGSALAMRQLTLVTSRLAQAFTIDSPNAASAPPRFLGRLAPTALRTRLTPSSRQS